MINIFPNSNAKRKVSRKPKRGVSSVAQNAALGKSNLESLDPMVIPLLAVKVKQQPNNEFVTSSISVITERPHRLTEKWIASLNSWCKSISEAIMLDEPSVEIKSRMTFDDMVVAKICKSNPDSEYPMPALICSDERGWKWYFKTSKAYSFNVGDSISFVATVSAHKEGITFLRRPSKIVKIAELIATADSIKKVFAENDKDDQ